jgi:cob(I)alamin adenosyltransferase
MEQEALNVKKTDHHLKKGYVQMYIGDGKGKTTAALGLALRAVGRGLQVSFIQFLKGEPSGEHLFAEKYDCFEIIQPNKGNCFQQSNEELLPITEETFSIAEEKLTCGDYDIIILDEIFTALARKLITRERVIELIDKRPDNVELVLTGRRAPSELIERADLVTEMTAVKHYYQRGIKLRTGIEY